MAVLTEPELLRRIDDARRYLAEGDLEHITKTALSLARLAPAVRRLPTSGLIAQEMTRRCERALGQALRAGAMEEEFLPDARRRTLLLNGVVIADVGNSYLSEAVFPQVDEIDDELFEKVLERCRYEGNISRDRVIESLRPGANTRWGRARRRKRDEEESQTGRVPRTWRPVNSQERLDRIAALAIDGHNSAQIGRIIGQSTEYVRVLAARADIIIPADEVNRRSIRIDPTRVVQNTIDTLAGITVALEALDIERADFTEAPVDEWDASLDRSISKLTQLHRRISRKATHS